MARGSQDDRRDHYRLGYPEAERPTVRINDVDYLVADLSEGGARILLAGGPGLPQDERFAGTVLFPDGEAVPIEGVVLRSTEKHMVVKLSKAIGQKRMIAEQRRIHEKYPLFFDSPEGGAGRRHEPSKRRL